MGKQKQVEIYKIKIPWKVSQVIILLYQKIVPIIDNSKNIIAQSTGAVEYTNYFYAVG